MDNRNRRKFIYNSSFYGIGGIIAAQFLSCKGNEKNVSTEIMKEPEVNIRKKFIIPQDAPYQMEYLRGNVGFFNERGGTVGWMISEGGNVIIDTQFQPQAENLLKELKKVESDNIALLINTHHHGDHTSGNVVFKNNTSRVLAHVNSKSNQERVAKDRDSKDAVLPNETFETSKVENIGPEIISLNYYGRAHTDGDSVIHFQNANVAHLGDLVFNRRYPYIDKSSGALINNWINVLDEVNTVFDDDTIFIFGHCGKGYKNIGDKEDIRAFKNYLEKLMELGVKCNSQGLSKQDMLDNYSTIPGAPEWMGDGIERSINAVYQEVNEG